MSLVLEVMGLPPGAGEARHSLADMGIDSMQQASTGASEHEAVRTSPHHCR